LCILGNGGAEEQAGIFQALLVSGKRIVKNVIHSISPLRVVLRFLSKKRAIIKRNYTIFIIFGQAKLFGQFASNAQKMHF
jgi:hypothetical protein